MSIYNTGARLSATLLVIGALLLSTGCTSASSDHGTMPDFVADAPPRVKEAYQYAVEHPDHLKSVPCYCGCGRMGHTSNLSCFVKEMTENGEVVYDDHASACGVCVDIAQDVMRLRGEGKTASQVRAYIDATYSSVGPGTDTPLPVD